MNFIAKMFQKKTFRCQGRTSWGKRCKIELPKSQLHSNDLKHYFCGPHFSLKAKGQGTVKDSSMWGFHCCRNHTQGEII
jgi:hypothetical protein